MNLAAFRKEPGAIRNACTIGILLMVALLTAGSLRGADTSRAVTVGVLAAVSLGCLAIAHRQVGSRLAAAEEIRRLQLESSSRSAALATAALRHTETLDNMIAGCQLIGFDWRYLYVNDAVARHGRQEKSSLVGRTMMECYPGIEDTPTFAVLRRCMESRAPAHLENEFTHPDGTVGWFELSVQPVPEGIFVVSIDITDRKQAEVNTRRQLERLQSLRVIDMAILSGVDLNFTLRTILKEARSRLRADGADIRFFHPESLTLDVVASTGRCGVAPHSRLGRGIVGTAARERRTVAVPDTAAYEDSSFVDPTVLDAGTRAVYATPLIAKGRLIGAFTVTFEAPFDADHDWLDFFETVAGQSSMAIESGKMFDELQRTNLDLRLAYDTTIEGWSRALDLRDKETEGHTRRVTELTVKIARRAGMTEAQIVNVRRGALLHDIGKMGVPDHILLKPDKLTDDEWRLMKQHPTYAYELLKPIEYLRDALDIPYCHHEKWDGSGYPRGLRGEQIPLAARLFAVVDVWDAIRSDRPYRSGWTEERALEFIRSVSGTHLDPEAVALFMSVHGAESEVYSSYPAPAG